jgi:carbon monoxide dehydrogenase subunit G
MDVTGSYPFAAPPEAVWKALTDPVVIAGCLPGCDRLDPIGDDKYRAAVTLAVAAVSGNYTGTLSMLDKNPPHSYRLVVEGSGKPGFVNGEATIELIADDDGTTVRVTGHGNVGGVIARVGQRLLGSVSKMMMDRFFSCLQSRM